MKKFLTLAALMASAFTMTAEVPELLFQDKPVTDGATYETGFTVDVKDFGVFQMYSYIQNSDLTLRGIEGRSVTVEVNASETVSVCSIDGNCMTGANVTKADVLGRIAGEVIDRDGNLVTIDMKIDKITSDMSGKPANEILHDITVNVAAYYTDSPDEKTTVTVILTNRPASEVGGIGSVSSDSYVRLTSGRILSYNVAVPTKLCIYGISGNLMMGRMIYNEGSVSLDCLPAGVYVFRAGSHTGKILVK